MLHANKHFRRFLTVLCWFSMALTPLLAAPTSTTSQIVLSPNIQMIPDNGIGFNLRLPSNVEVMMPGGLQVISVVQVWSGSLQPSEINKASENNLQRHSPPSRYKVEIAAEKLPATLTYEAWQTLQESHIGTYASSQLSVTATQVSNYPARFRTVMSPEGLIWETEIYVNHTVYRVVTMHSPEIEPLYQAVVEGLEFAPTNQLPANEQSQTDPSLLNPLPQTTTGEQAPTAMPTLKFPFNGTETITCAYYADDPNCHPGALIALDFSLTTELVRAAHEAPSRTYFYDSCVGTALKLYATDATYYTLYGHLTRYLTQTTGLAENGRYVAISGNTGSCTTGAHLHWLLNRSGTNIKPEPTCDQTGFRRYQTKTDCWSADYRFTSAATSSISIDTAGVNLRVCDTGRKGRVVAVSMWRPAAQGYSERSWRQQATLSNSDGCYTFTNLDGSGNTLSGVYYYTNVALHQEPQNYFPADAAAQQKTSCFTTTNQRILCDRIRR